MSGKMMGKKRKLKEQEKLFEKVEEKRSKKESPGTELKPVKEIDLPSKHATTQHIKNQEKRLIVILEQAHLETVKWGKGFGILNVDDHSTVLKRSGRDFSTARPDILHQSLLMLLDSPLNRAGFLQVYIHTANNVLIEVNPQTRIPRTFPRFAGLMVQLLHKFSIKASDSSAKLLKVIKNPVTDHLPVGCKKILMSYGAEKVVKASDIVPDSEDPICVVIGAIAKGHVQVDYTEDTYCIGNYPLSAALCCTKVCSAFEEAWGVL